ncbi:MAG: energy-coupled thiamine transporter ThiT [Clostridia bacterium]|nr:energy-coupled thiamine transporter ThiT [Clostridia bacterium]
MQQKSVYRLVESALLLAMAAVLSVIKIIDMPYGGSVTAFSMLPLLIIAYRYGTKWGMLTAFTYSLIQLLLGMENFSYVTGFTSMAALALFDYLLAFLVLGLGALFRRQNTSQTASLVLAAVVTGVLRYLCHCVSGFTVWRDLSVPFSQSLAYSLSYNATYMIPEIIILAIGAVYISRVLSFDNAGITRVAAQKTASPAALTFSILAKTALLVAAVWVVVLIAPAMQSADSGELFLAGLAGVKWLTVAIVAAVGAAVFGVLTLISKKISK